jgi:tetratricopeptide (TPR) repeat protein
VIPTLQQLEAISRLNEGTFPDTPFAALLLSCALHRRTGVLEVRRKQLAKKLSFEQGALVDCRSNLVHETLGRYMVATGKLPEDELLPYLNESASRSVPLGEILLAHEVVGAEELFRILQQNLAQKLLDVFTWKDGEFHSLSEAQESASPLKIRIPQLIVTGIIKCAPLAEVESGVVPLVGKRLALNPSPPFSLDEIRLGSRHAGVPQALRSGLRLDELATSSGLPFEELNRLVYALALLGLVVPVDALPKRATVPVPHLRSPAPPAAAASEPAPLAGAPPEAAPAAAAPAADAAAELDAERRNELMQAFLAYRRQDALDLLGLPENATLADVEEAYLSFAERYAPWRYPNASADSIDEKARALFFAGAHAYGELTDAERRNTLLLRRETLREERRRQPPGGFRIKTDLLDSEAQFRKGRALMEQGRYRDAVLQLEFAADCEPQNGIYAAELAYCRFLSSPSNSGQALGELREALRRDPECGIALYYAGEIERSLHHFEEAESLLRRAIKALSPDRRPIQALKALAAERKRS